MMDDKRIQARERLNQVFCDVFDDEMIKITDEMTAQDIEEWDSLMHIILVVAVEKEFRIRFKAAEVGGFRNVGEMLDAIVK